MNTTNKFYQFLAKQYNANAIKYFTNAQKDDTFVGDYFTYYKKDYLLIGINATYSKYSEYPTIESFIVKELQTNAVYIVTPTVKNFMFYDD